MTDTLVFRSTSSGPSGWSSLGEYLECSAKADALRQSRGSRPTEYAPFPEEKGKPVATTVGSLYGELCQLWLRGSPPRPSTQLFWEANGETQDLQKTHPGTVAEVWRLYEKYTTKYKPDHWGEILGCEVPVRIPGALFGLDFDITGAIDLLVRHPTLGLGVVDLKTEGRTDANLRMKFSLREQIWLYALGLELSTDFGKPDFCAIDLCVKNKEPVFDKLVYEAVTDKRFAWLRQQIDGLKAGMAAPKPSPHIAHCWKYNRACDFFVNDTCSLIKV